MDPTDERRRYPRANGPLHLRYVRAPDAPELWRRWETTGEAPAPLRAPDPWMNFSCVGVAFDDALACAEGDFLLVEIGLPDRPEDRWRTVGRVVRVTPVPIDERDEASGATHRIAVSLEELPRGPRRALQAYTGRLEQANGRDR